MLTKKERAQLMREFNERNSINEVEISSSDFARANQQYEKVMTEKRWKGIDKLTDTSVFQDILDGIASGETDSTIFTQLSDNKHMAFFNNFGEDGLADKLIDALKAHGISTDVLKSVTRGSKFTDVDDVTNDGVRVQIIWGEDEDGYYYMDSISITKENDNGEEETVFEWESEGIIDEDTGEFEPLKKWTYVDKDEFDTGNTIAYQEVTTPKYTYREEKFKTSTGKDTTRKRYAAGTVINGVKVGGRFIK